MTGGAVNNFMSIEFLNTAMARYKAKDKNAVVNRGYRIKGLKLVRVLSTKGIDYFKIVWWCRKKVEQRIYSDMPK